jgi:Caspase domain
MPRRIAYSLLLLVALTIALTSEAFAQKRIALIIGNSAYTNVSKLPNPANDAAAVADMFKKANFEVVEMRQDLGVTELKRVLRDFADLVRDADIAVVFYAGHGIEVDGTNYLLPIDAALARDVDVEDEAVSLDRIVRILEPAKRLRLVILDACRDNPFDKSMKRTLGTRSVGRGLAKVEPTSSDTLIAFAAKAGSTAADGEGRNSPFTAALVKNIVLPGLDLRIAFGRVRDEVLKVTGNKQEPFVYGSLGGSTVALVPRAAAPKPAPNQGAQPEAARRDYELAERVGTKEAWDAFLSAHKTGLYADLARSARAKLDTTGSTPSVERSASLGPGGYDGLYSGQVCFADTSTVKGSCIQVQVKVEQGKFAKEWHTREGQMLNSIAGELTATGDAKIELKNAWIDGRSGGSTINFSGKIQNNRLEAAGNFLSGRPATLSWQRH